MVVVDCRLERELAILGRRFRGLQQPAKRRWDDAALRPLRQVAMGRQGSPSSALQLGAETQPPFTPAWPVSLAVPSCDDIAALSASRTFLTLVPETFSESVESA